MMDQCKLTCCKGRSLCFLTLPEILNALVTVVMECRLLTQMSVQVVHLELVKVSQFYLNSLPSFVACQDLFQNTLLGNVIGKEGTFYCIIYMLLG